MPFQLANLVRPEHRHAFDAAVAQYGAQALEDYHTGVEAAGAPALALALKGDLSFYADEDRCIPFLYYLAMQHMRTKGIKEAILAVNGAGHPFDLTRVWNLCVIMFAETIGGSLFFERRRRTLIVVENTTDVPFITGDQPMINLKAAGSKPPERLSIFYPISATSALLLSDEDEDPLYPAQGLTREQAASLNTRMAEASYQQVFAHTEASLQALP